MDRIYHDDYDDKDHYDNQKGEQGHWNVVLVFDGVPEERKIRYFDEYDFMFRSNESGSYSSYIG